MAFASTFTPSRPVAPYLHWQLCGVVDTCRYRALPLRMTATPASRVDALRVDPIHRLSGEIDLPGSKSLSNRILLLAALSHGNTAIQNLLDSDDVRYMTEALRQLGVSVSCQSSQKIPVIIRGCSGTFPRRTASLFLGNAGTAMRPLTAALAFQRGIGSYILDGTPRMRERPIGDLVDGLAQLGANVQCSPTKCPPVNITTSENGISQGGTASVSGRISSQYLSALLMAAPLAANDVTIEISDTLVSVPYVDMTVKLMSRFGVSVEYDAARTKFLVRAPQTYIAPAEIFVEGDASSASYFLAGAALTGGPVTVRGCGIDSLQGDVQFARVLEKMGAVVHWEPQSITVSRPADVDLHGVDVDAGDIPDAAMSLATTALFAKGQTAIRNVYNWRVKETERMKAIVTELTKLGAKVEEGHDYCVITPPQNGVRENVEIDTYDDHRMAMAFSLVACGGVPVIIKDPSCTAKTFPTYFDELKRLS